MEGKNIVIEYRYAEGKLDRLLPLAAELVRVKVDIILTAGGSPTRAAKAATSTIPIVMMNDADPVADGFVASLARPGGNITGLSIFAPELGGKRLELLKEVVPQLSRVAVLGNSTAPGYAPTMREMELAAKVSKVTASIPRRIGAKGYRDRIPSRNQGASRRSPHATERNPQYSASTDCRTCDKESASRDIP